MEPKTTGKSHSLCSTLDIQLKLERLVVTQEKDIEAIRREIDLMFEAKAKALELNLAENEKHFIKLNHEAEQLKSMQATYIPREVHDAQITEIGRLISILNTEKDKAAGRGVVNGIIVSFLIGLIFVVINLFFSGKL